MQSINTLPIEAQREHKICVIASINPYFGTMLPYKTFRLRKKIDSYRNITAFTTNSGTSWRYESIITKRGLIICMIIAYRKRAKNMV